MTRKEYMERGDQDSAHREYYSQFVTEGIRQAVSLKFGDKIHQSECPHFNDIPLVGWDSLAKTYSFHVAHKNKELNGSHTFSLCEGVCMLKEAAQQIREEKA